MCRLHWISARTAWLFVGSLGVAACRRRLQGQVCGDIARRRGARRVFLLCLFASEDTIEPDGRPRRANTLLAARYRSKHVDAAYVCPKKAAEAHHGHTRCLRAELCAFSACVASLVLGVQKNEPSYRLATKGPEGPAAAPQC